MATCANHPETAATAYCRTCGKPLCDQCKRDVRGVIYCEDCLAARVQGTFPAVDVPPPPPGAAAPPPAASAPSVGLATFLGFIPGMGALYNGQFAKAFAHIVIFAILVNVADRVEAFGLFVAAFIVYMVVDAHQTAKARVYGRPLPDFLGLNNLFGGPSEAPGVRAATGQAFQRVGAGLDAAAMARNKAPIGAIALIGLGLLFLLDNMGVMSMDWLQRFWPVFVIAFGVWLGYRRWISVEEA